MRASSPASIVTARAPNATYERTNSFLPTAIVATDATSPETTHADAVVLPDLRSRIPAQSLMEQLSRLRSEGGFELSENGRRTGIPPEARSWYKGALGERHVATILARLGPEWTVLHSVPVGGDGSDIDHILIGPPGVYTLNTKNHPGKTAWVAGHGMMIGGQRTSYLRNSSFEARRAEKLLTIASGLTVEAAGLIVLVGVTQLTIRSKPDGGEVVVGVVRDRDLLAALKSRRIYSDEQVQCIVDAAVRPQTWSRLPLPVVNITAILAEFNELENGVTASDSHERRKSAFRNLGAAPVQRPNTRSRSGSGSSGTRRRKRKPSPLEAVMQLAGLLIAGWIALTMLSHH